MGPSLSPRVAAAGMTPRFFSVSPITAATPQQPRLTSVLSVTPAATRSATGPATILQQHAGSSSEPPSSLQRRVGHNLTSRAIIRL